MKTILLASVANGMLWALFVGIGATLVVELFDWSHSLPLILALLAFVAAGAISTFWLGFFYVAHEDNPEVTDE